MLAKWTMALALVAACAGQAAAADDRIKDEAQRRFVTGRALYEQALYEQAMGEFKAGFALVSRPEFLINIAQCARKLGRPVEARDWYRRFLTEAPARHPRRAEVEEIVAALDEEIASAAPPEEPPPAGKPPPRTQAPATAAVSEPAPVAAPPNALSAHAPPPKRGIRKYWWLIPVVTVAAAGVAVGLGLGLTQKSSAACDPKSMICVSAQ